MDFVIIALIVVAVWIGLLVFVLAVCKASGRADAAEERYLADEFDEQRKPIDRAELERDAERLRIDLPERPRLRVTRLVGPRRHRS
ncbi:MAG: hypothetical protein ACTHMY_28335 [Solirubrobacteraceae bacterium]